MKKIDITLPQIVCAIIGLLAGIVFLDPVVVQYFPQPPGQFSYSKMIASGVVGGLCAGIGALIGLLFSRKSPRGGKK